MIIGHLSITSVYRCNALRPKAFLYTQQAIEKEKMNALVSYVEYVFLFSQIN